MELLLALAGVVTAFVIGWSVGLRRRVTSEAVPAPSPSTPVSPSADEILGGHPTGVVVAGPDGVIRFRNDAARSLSGTHVGVLVDESVERHLQAALETGEHSEEVLELYGPPKKFVDVDAIPLTSGHAVAFIEDISETRRIDQIRTDFVANVSHELKTPIGAMSVLAETLLDEPDHATIQRVVDRMMGEAQRASRTIEDLMELSRIELGGERVVEPVTVSDIIRAGIERVTELSMQREISINALEPVDEGRARSAQLVVHGDRRQLVSALGNLIENAVKYSSTGDVVTVRAREADGFAEISVIDQGVGVPQRDLDRIFERFYRVDRARSRATGGTGLGLSIVRHVATNHDGAVLVTSAEGEGSTFVLRLPLRRGEAETNHANANSEGVA